MMTICPMIVVVTVHASVLHGNIGRGVAARFTNPPATLPQQSSSETILEPIVMDVCCSTSHRRWSLEPTDHDDGWTLLPNNHQEKQHTADDDEDFETVGQGGFRAQCDLRKRLWFIFICLFAQRTALSLIPRLTTGGMERSDRPYSSLFNI